MKKVIAPLFISAILWFIMFSPWTAPHVNFWISMGISASILIALSVFIGKDIKKQCSFNSKDILIGITSAIVLWAIFYIGDFVSSQLFDFAKPQVSNIYEMKTGENTIFLSLLLLFLVGPAEEIFWRGFVQKTWGEKHGEWIAFFGTTIIYALVHIWSFNFMLVMAALVCGAFWGLLYKYNKNLITLIISHAVWDVAVFIIFPIV
jgi:membrane protease YdiL (CAAX protease family)